MDFDILEIDAFDKTDIEPEGFEVIGVVRDLSDGSHVAVITNQEDIVVAMCSIEVCEYSLNILFLEVHPDFRGQGISGFALEQIADYAALDGLNLVTSEYTGDGEAFTQRKFSALGGGLLLPSM